MQNAELKKLLPPPRDPSAHKRSFGRLQIVAGSAPYPGAGLICALGAFKAGCGYIYVETGAPLEILRDLPEVIPGFHCDADAFVVGPGLDPSWDLARLNSIIMQIPTDKALVLDGGALAFFRALQVETRAKVVVTPHEGELAKILGSHWSAEKIRADKMAAALAFTSEFPNTTLLLKGSPTLVAREQSIESMNQGSVAMATAGQGDLLSGVIGAYLALGLALQRSALLSAYLCAQAATELTANREPQGALAHEVANQLPLTIAQLRKSL